MTETETLDIQNRRYLYLKENFKGQTLKNECLNQTFVCGCFQEAAI